MVNVPLNENEKRELIRAALAARQYSYSPYSNYAVGAAILAEDGRIVTGCNVENASYGATNCAERTAFFKAISEGITSFRAIAIAGGMSGQPPMDFAYPCGVCRQVMQELGGPMLQILVAKNEEDYKVFTLEQLLPFGFGGESLR